MLCLRLLIVLAVVAIGKSYIPPSTVQSLYSNLTSGYDPRLRPNDDQNSTVLVKVLAWPYTVLELSTSYQRLSILMYFSIMWNDHSLIWNTTDYAGIDNLVFQLDEIWHPRILIGLSYSENAAYIGDDKDMLRVNNNGRVMWIATSKVSLLCVVDIVFYPFDTQKCNIFIYVPFSLFDVILLRPIEGFNMLASLQDNPEWHLLDINTTTDTVGIEQNLQYTYLFRRRAEFIVYTTIVPIILLSVLNACVVLVPVSSGENGSIAVTLFLSYCVYMAAIGETLPPNSVKTSYLLLYMTIVHTFSALTMLYSVVETRVYIYGTTYLNADVSCLQKKEHNCDDKENTTPGDISKQAKSDSPRTEDSLYLYRKMDLYVFLVSIVLNTTVVTGFAILTMMNIHHALE